MLIYKPKELSWEQAAGIPEVSFSHPLHLACLLLFPFLAFRFYYRLQKLRVASSCAEALTACNGNMKSLFGNSLICTQTWITATQALYLVANFTPGKSILWRAGASSVSIAGIQLSKADNASQIFVTAGSDEKVNFCVEKLGATAGTVHSMSTLSLCAPTSPLIYCHNLYEDGEDRGETSEGIDMIKLTADF